MKHLMALGLVISLTQIALGEMAITEWMYDGDGGEFVEFTNVGSTAIDMAGWSFDDADQIAGTVSLSDFGVVAPGQSVILTEVVAADFATNWGLTGVSIIGGNTNKLGRADTINLFDAGGNLIDQLAYDDETYTGTVRTKGASCNIPATDYSYTTAQSSWVLATVGDTYGSWTSALGEIASPGQIVPEPLTLAMFLCGGLVIARRRR